MSKIQIYPKSGQLGVQFHPLSQTVSKNDKNGLAQFSSWNPDDNDVAELQTSPDFGQSLYINKNLDFK